MDYQNNYVERLNIFDNAVKYFDILAISLNVLIILTKLFFDLYPAKFLDTSVGNRFFRTGNVLYQIKYKKKKINCIDYT